MTIEDDERNHLSAHTERVTNGFNIAVNRQYFSSFDDVRYGARVRYRYTPKGGSRTSWIDDEICCYLKEISDARIAASKFSRFFLAYSLRPTPRLVSFVTRRRSRDSERDTPIDSRDY